MTETIRIDEWLAALNQLAAHATSHDGMTVSDMVDAGGGCAKTIQNRLRKALASGDWERCRVWREDLAGRTVPLPAYRPKQAAKAAAKRTAKGKR